MDRFVFPAGSIRATGVSHEHEVEAIGGREADGLGKPWSRYEVNFINHDKFRALPSNAICLWLEGKNYADAKHTDGLLPDYEVKHWRFYSTRNVAALTSSVGQKPGTGQPYAPLWEVHSIGFKMHDYLDHNDCREQVMVRIEAVAEKQQRWKENKRLFRDRKHAEAAARREALSSALSSLEPRTDTRTDPRTDPRTPEDKSLMSSANQKQNTEPEPQIEFFSLSESERRKRTEITRALGREKLLEPLPPIPSNELGNRAARLLERYTELFCVHRRGARFRPRPALDYPEAVALCETWDDARLEQLAVIVLTTDDPFIAGTDRSFKIFSLKASWADDRLKQAETGAIR